VADEGWERIYAESGEVQRDILDVVVHAAAQLERHACDKIMDLGCGTGRHTVYLARRGFTVYAADISPTGIEIAKLKVRALSLRNVSFAQLDLTRLPLGEGCLDAILCIWTTGHGRFADVKRCVDEMHRVVKVGGLVIADFYSTQDEDYGRGVRVEEHTFFGGVEGEEHITHHFSTRGELRALFTSFQEVQIHPITYSHPEWGSKVIEAFYVEAIK
jgi:ubiquinone/menaquinone biosynthesis C-methylase UbiE